MARFSLDRIIDMVDNDHTITLYNDDTNTFEHVIAQLNLHCGYGIHQSIQCVTIVDNVGHYEIKKGSLSKLRPIANKLKAAGLRVELN